MLPALAHDVQLVLVPKHVWHVALQLRHSPRPSFVERKSPIEQTVVHVPAPTLKLAPATQEAQLVDVPPVHVAQEAWQLTHTSLASAYLPAGQLATHEPSS